MIPTGTAARTNCVQLWPTANCTSAHHPCRQSGGGSTPLSLTVACLIYNQEDCAAAQTVAEALSALSRSGATDFVDASALKREYPKRFGKIDFALPEFQQDQ